MDGSRVPPCASDNEAESRRLGEAGSNGWEGAHKDIILGVGDRTITRITVNDGERRPRR
jgi:hypothetical protein